MANGYEVNMRRDKRTGEHLAVIPGAYRSRHGERYYMAICESGGCWAELSPEYLTRNTVTTSEYPEWLKRAIDRNLGYVLNLVDRLAG